jgi:thiamine biosynthesis protein ThiS
VQVQVNSEPLELADGATVADLLRKLGRDPDEDAVAVALNLAVLPRSDYAEQALDDGDRVDLVTAVGGG